MQRICPVKDFNVDVKTLLKEYRSAVESSMEPVVTHHNAVLVQKKFHIVRRTVGDRLLDSMPYTQEIAQRVHGIFKFADMTYRIVMPNTAYNWHVDRGIVYHIPLITAPGCLFVYESESYTMPTGSLYGVHNGVPHTFVNASSQERLHLTFEVL